MPGTPDLAAPLPRRPAAIPVRRHGRGILLAVAALALVPAPLPAQSDAALEAVDRYVRQELARQGIPGLSLAVLRGDRVVLSRGYGVANLEHRVPATDSTVYQSGSVGKQFTASLVAMLAEEGRLQLDDPVRRHLPEGPPAWDSITIRHLLTHTSGIPDYTEDAVDYRRDYSEEDLLRLAAGLPLSFGPGERWSYSNTGYVLLGIIVRRVTGAFYGDVLQERFFRPLGMATARIISERDIVPNRSDGYELVEGRVQHQEWVAPALNTTADGSLYLTVRDLSRWAAALEAGRIPGAAVLRASWTPVALRTGGTFPYGLGWDLADHRGRRRIGHGGSWQGFRASIQRFPEFGLTVIVLANLAEAEPEALSLAIAGLLEPALRPAHLTDVGGGAPPLAIGRLVAALAGGDSTAAASPRLRGFLSTDVREALAAVARPEVRWTPAGCDDVSGRRLERLGLPLARICYARATAAGRRRLFTVTYTEGWQAVTVDWYDY